MTSRPARSMSRMASWVASSCACSRNGSGTRHSSRTRVRGTILLSMSRFKSQSGCGYEPTTVVCSNPWVMYGSSLQADAGLFDQRGVVLELARDALVELGRRARCGVGAERAQSILDLGRGERGGDLLVQPFDQGGRRAGRRQHADPEVVGAVLVARFLG